MSKKKENKNLHTGKKHPNKRTLAVKSDVWKDYSLLSLILLLTFIVYLPVLQNGFVNWDDDEYIQNNLLIRSIDLKELFSNYVMGNYHPVTMLAFSIEYHFFGLNETGYHFVNLLLHLLNVILIFYTVFHFSEKKGVALIASLLFGIHPLHVESVAWASELKDLLYTLFFLASFIFYLKYVKGKQNKNYFVALLFFIFSLLSKALAASLPLVLLLTDYFMGRKITFKTLLEKIPFFILALTLGFIAINAQRSSGALQDFEVFTFPQRLVFACYEIVIYIYKLLFPFQLSVIYPYPTSPGEQIPLAYIVYVILFLGLVAGIIYSLRFSKKVSFGTGFFTISIFLVLQLFPVGDFIMADRYSYIPSIGIFYLFGEGINYLCNRKFKFLPTLILISFTLFFSIKTYSRCSIWKNSLTLWNDVISQYQTVPIAYNNRGLILMSENKNQEALSDFNKAIELKPDLSMAYYNRGILFKNENNNKAALNDFSKAIQLKSDYTKAYNNRGIIFVYEHKNMEALEDFNKAIELNHNNPDAFRNRANVYFSEKRYEEAISDYSKSIELNPNHAESYYFRGLSEYYSGKKDAACSDFREANNLGFLQAQAIFLQACK